MKYLIRHNSLNQPNGRAHIVVGTDTACHQWSTGGMNRKRNWKISDKTKGMRVCKMCQTNYKKTLVPDDDLIPDIEWSEIELAHRVAQLL